MAWSYSGDPSFSDVDKYRFLITDTIEDEPLLQNEEISYVLAESAIENVRLYSLYKAVSDKLARDIIKSLGPQSQDPTKRQEYFKERMEFYRKRCFMAGLTVPAYSSTAAFAKGLHDNV